MLLNELTRKFDYVIVDTPAAEHGADARVIGLSAGRQSPSAAREQLKPAVHDHSDRLVEEGLNFAGSS